MTAISKPLVFDTFPILTCLVDSLLFVCPPPILNPTFLSPDKVISTTLLLSVVPKVNFFTSKPPLLISIPILEPETVKWVSRLSSVVVNSNALRLCILIIEEWLPPETLPTKFFNLTVLASELPLPL